MQSVAPKIEKLTRWVYVALIFSVISSVAVFGMSYYILHGNQIAACERGNKVRKIISDNSVALSTLIKQAIEARKTSGDLDVAAQYSETLKLVQPSPPVNCGGVIR